MYVIGLEQVLERFGEGGGGGAENSESVAPEHIEKWQVGVGWGWYTIITNQANMKRSALFLFS